MNYYNENDPKAAAWLRELMRERLIPSGEIDQRSITDVSANDLSGFTQCHFFAGIGGWSYALSLAGWPEDEPVWTGSCPCQPFSIAGKGLAESDPRHLWPVFKDLIAERTPATVFGEQVASPAGRKWLSRVRADMEALGYAFGAADLCAACVGSPHIRQRLWWCASNFDCSRLQARHEPREFRAEEVPPAWSEFKRVHAAGDWARREAKSSIPVFMDGLSGRVERTRGFGNAIVPQVAAEFIAAFMEVVCARQ